MVVLVARFVPELDAALGETVAVPVNDGARLLAEDLDEVLIDVTGRVLGHHRHEIKLIDLRAPGLLIAGVETAHVAAHAGARRETIDADHLGAFFGSRADRKETARAAADNEHIGGIGRGDALFSNLRRLAEPIARIRISIGAAHDDFNGDFTLGLCNALAGGLHDGIRRDGSARNDINLSRLGRHERSLESFGSRLTDGRGLVGNIENDIRDAVFVKGHRNNNVADAGSLSRIRARDIKSLGGFGGQGGRGDGRDGERRAAGKTRSQERTAREIRHVSSLMLQIFVTSKGHRRCSQGMRARRRTAEGLQRPKAVGCTHDGTAGCTQVKG